MVLKLLQKREVDKAKAVERQLEIDEGMKLAKRVDSLRMVQAQEERSLNDFRVKMVAEISSEITALTDTVASLKKEVAEIEALRAEGLSPLTQYEQDIVNRQKYIDTELEKIAVKKDELRVESEHLAQWDELLKSVDERLEKKQNFIHKEIERLDTLSTHINRKNKILHEDTEAFEKQKHSFEKDFIFKNEQLDARTKVLDRLSEQIQKESERLTKKEIELNDREQLLARNIKRFNK
jgi:coenzyme F420-reducing hydrogenase delta subunit